MFDKSMNALVVKKKKLSTLISDVFTHFRMKTKLKKCRSVIADGKNVSTGKTNCTDASSSFPGALLTLWVFGLLR